jgi:Thioredoxin
MAYTYTSRLIDSALTYQQYRDLIRAELTVEPANAGAERLRPYLASNAALMDEYDETYRVLPELQEALALAPPTTWLVISEGWCGDAAYNVPLMHVAKNSVADRIKLRIVLRDSNFELMDANLTDGGRSIPKLIVLDDKLQPIGYWGPRPAGLQILMKDWKSEGLEIKQLIPKVHSWYTADNTRSVQQELMEMIKSYT